MQDLNDLQYFAQVVRHGGFLVTRDRRAQVEAQQTGGSARAGSGRSPHRALDLQPIQVTEIGRDGYAQCEVIAGGIEATEAIVARSRDEVRGTCA